MTTLLNTAELIPQSFKKYGQLEVTKDVAVVTIDQENESVNKIAPDMIAAFNELISLLTAQANLKGIVLISGKKDFIAGADLDNVYATDKPGIWEAHIRNAHRALNKLEKIEIPVIAAIHGACKGGGLEIALACHYRMATNSPKTVFALPEVNLGLLPAGGGTQRLPQLIGIRQALDILLTGKNIYARPAKKMGLVDKLVHPDVLKRAAIEQALAMYGKKVVRKDARSVQDKLLESNPITRGIIFDKALEQIMQKTKGNYPAPFKILDAVSIGITNGRAAGLDAEARYFDELAVHPIAKRLIGLFFANTNKKKEYNKDKALTIDTLGLIGAGFMGEGIAQISATKNIEVLLKDKQPQVIAQAKSNINKALDKKVKYKTITPFEQTKTINRIQRSLSYQNFDKADMVIEAVFENLDLKQRILAEVEANTRQDCIYASNTSAIPIHKIAENSKRPDQVIGMHYFSPVPKMPLLEIVKTDQTADWVIATAYQLGVKQGKTPIVVNDGPGFYTTRILGAMLNETLLMLEEGASIEQLDEAGKSLGFPVGPVTLLDEVGLDVAAHIMKGDLMHFFKSQGSFSHSTAIEQVNKAGYQGRKNQRGFFNYDEKGKKKKGDDAINTKIYQYFGGEERKQLPDKEVRRRLLLMITNQAIACLGDGTLQSAKDGDIGAVFGLGYPPYTGGPFHYTDGLGASRIVKRLEKMALMYGSRFEPTALLRKMAEENTRFYEHGAA